MNYEEIISRALRITWRHRYLWLLALLAGEGGGLTLSNLNRSSGRPSTRSGGLRAPSSTEVATWLGTHEALLVAAVAATVVLAVAWLLISAVANGAMVRASAEHDADRPFDLRAGWRSGRATFARVLGLKVIGALVYLAGFALIGSSVLAAAVAAGAHQVPLAIAAGAAAAVLVLLAIPGLLVFQVALLLGIRAAVLDDRSPRAALAAGFALIRRRFARMAVVWLLVGVVVTVLAVGGGVLVAIAAVPLAGIVIGAFFVGGVPVAVVVAAVLGLAWLALALVLLGAVSAFYSTAWTLAYTRFDAEPLPASSPTPVPA